MKNERNGFRGYKQRFAFRTNARTSRGRQGQVCFELLEARALLAADAAVSMRNFLNRADVNGDGHVSAIDALTIINDLTANGARSVSSPTVNSLTSSTSAKSSSSGSAAGLDVNSDGMVSAADAGAVINALNNPGPSVVVTLKTTDMSGNAISTIEAGQAFLLEVDVQDIRTTSTAGGFGVFSEYVDVDYSALLASVEGSLTFGQHFPSVQTPKKTDPATTTPGHIVDAGAVGELSASFDTGPADVETLWTVQVVAKSDGLETFSGSPSTKPGNQQLVYGENTPLTGDQVQFVDASINITPSATAPAVSIGNVTHAEGNVGTTPFVFTVELSHTADSQVTVQYATADGTATTANSDYVPQSGTLTFAPGTFSQTVTILVNGDTAIEPNETFSVNLSNPSGASATLGTAQGIGTITNDDIGSSLAISNISQSEGNAGTTNFVFSVTLSAASQSQVTVQYNTNDGTATTADNDYQAKSGTLTFAAGATAQTITIAVNGDSKAEANETFTVTLHDATNASISTATGTGTILNDDGTAILASPVSSTEGNSGTTPFVFNVTLSASSTQQVTVAYATADGTATTADNDYQAKSGTLTFAAGTTSQAITVLVNGDTKFEGDETFTVNLSSPTNATLSTNSVTGTIVNDDLQTTTVSIGNVTQNEGNSGVTQFVFSVNLSQSSGLPVTVAYSTADGTATIADNDYAAQAGTLTFAPGVTQQTVTIAVNGDTKPEANETFTVNLSNPTNASLGTPQGLGTIANDDNNGTLSILGVSNPEGNSGTTPFVFTVTLSAAQGQPVTVAFSTADGSATTANNAYVAKSGTLTFAPGVTSQTVTIAVNGNTIVQPDETFSVNLSNPSDATVAVAQGTGTIVNDDTPGTLSIGNVSHSEGNSGVTPYVFTVNLATSQQSAVTVNYATADGSATTADSDYTAQSGTLTFAPGTTSQSITINVNGDTKTETDETFTVNLSNPTNATVAIAQGTGTIVNDDAPPPTLSIGNVSQSEGNSGTTNFVFTVTRSGSTTQQSTVNFATADGTATTADSDYAAQSGTLTFAAGVTSQTVTIAVNGDTKIEADETFTVNLSNATNATVSTAQGVGTIVNDDGTNLSSLSGFVYADVNNNGSFDTGTEQGLPGVTLTLTGTDSSDAAVSKQTTTDSNGFYQFTGLLPGQYTITETQPDGFMDGTINIGTQGGSKGTNQLTITLAVGSTVNGTGNNFGERGLDGGDVSKREFLNTSNDGNTASVASTSSFSTFSTTSTSSTNSQPSLSPSATDLVLSQMKSRFLI